MSGLQHDRVVDEVDWREKINKEIQMHRGKRTELLFFRVIHEGGEKILYTSPEEYENLHGQEVAQGVKDNWREKVHQLEGGKININRIHATVNH